MKYVIAGLGKFGRIALDRIQEQFPGAEILVLENHLPENLTDAVDRFTLVEADAVEYLADGVYVDGEDIIVPMVPIHLSALVILARQNGLQLASIQSELEAMVPNPVRIDDNTLCCSRADFLCPDDCPEGEHCTITGLPREEPLYDFLKTVRPPDSEMLVHRSYQILPGVGGYPYGDIMALEQRLTARRNLVATSCKCHGIITAIETKE